MKFYVLTFILAFLLAGCSIMEDYEPCTDTGDPDYVQQDYVNISFRIVAPVAGNSRTDNAGHTEAASEWPEFENRIYTDDIAFYIYAVLSDGTEPLLIKVDDFTNLTDPHTNISGGPENYTLHISLPKNDFENIVPSDEENIKLKIVAFANTNKAYNNLENYSTHSSLIDAASDWSYMMSGMIYSGTGGYRNNCRIPMFGTAEIEVKREEFYKTGPYAPLWGPDIYMLRSIAKLKIIDNIANRDEATGLPRIETVAFHGITDKAYMLPYEAEKYINGMQIETPNPCVGNTMQITMDHNPGNRTWIGYIPEQYLAENEPKVIINITRELKDNDNPADPETFEVPLSGYKDQKFDYFGNAILRNHVYTLSVDNADYAEAKITVKVADWTHSSLTLDYTETVTVNGSIQWNPNTYTSKEDASGNIVLRPWTTDVSGNPIWVPLEGRFTIATPIQAKWTASLITTQGDPVIFFLDDNGTPQLNISGIVDGKEAKLQIVSMDNTPNEQSNRARLRLVVTLANGTVLKVPQGYDNFTIIQNPL